MVKTLIDPDGRYAPLITDIIEDAGYSLVRVLLTSNKTEGQILQVMIEPEKAQTLNLDDCAAISRSIAAVFEVEDPIKGAYRLEVSSPGIDRPLTRLTDFECYKGFEIKAELQAPINTGQKRFRGLLQGVKNDEILLETEEGKHNLPFNEIKKASLVMTDTLIEASKENRI